MIKQSGNYIKRQKKKFLLWSLLWAILVMSVFVIGLVLSKTRSNYFTLVAGLLVLPLALNLTRLISFMRFRDGKEEYLKILETMKGSYAVFHSAIIPDARATILFEHIIVTTKSIYFLAYDKEVIDKNKVWLENRLSSKGIPSKNSHFIYIGHLTAVKNIAAKIEKDACYTSETLEHYTQIIQGMLM